jgi:hypothetical protein
MPTEQTPRAQDLRLVNGTHSASTPYDWITGPGASETEVTQSLVIQNNDAVLQTVTVRSRKYSGGYATAFEKEYEIAAGESEFIAELMGRTLNGDASNPDKITVEFDTALGASDTIDCIASSVKFSDL